MSFIKKLRSRDSKSPSSSSRKSVKSYRSSSSAASSYDSASSVSSGKYSRLDDAKEPLSVSYEKATQRQLRDRPIDDIPSPSLKPVSTESTTSSKASSKKKKKLGRWFDLSSLATPIAVHHLSNDFDGDDPNVYWDAESGVWRYWYYTWCPIF